MSTIAGERGPRPPVAGAVAGAARVTPQVFGVGVMVALLLALAGFAVTWATLPDFDFWWHLAGGRYIVTERALPVPDVFSATAAGRDWIAHEWLIEAAMYLAYRALGFGGVFALFGVCMAAAVLFTMRTIARTGAGLPLTAALTLLLVIAIVPFGGPRPQIAAFALLAALIWLLEGWLARGGRSIWAMPLLFALWGNIHGSFVLGLALPLLLLAGDLIARQTRWTDGARLATGQWRTLLAAIGASVAALLLNPNGPGVLLYPFSKSPNPLYAYLGEWGPLDIGNTLFWPVALLLGLYVTLLVVRRPRLPVSDLLLAGAFIVASLWYGRLAIFAAAVLVVLLARLLAAPADAPFRAPAWLAGRGRAGDHPRRARPLPALLQGLNAALVGAVVAGAVATLPRYDPAADARLPVAAVAALGADGLRLPLFHDYNWGGYLIWSRWPERVVFIDGRADDVYGDSGELAAYFAVAYLQPEGEGVLDRYGIQTVLFEKDAILVRYLLAGGGWRPLYDDGRVIALRRE